MCSTSLDKNLRDLQVWLSTIALAHSILLDQKLSENRVPLFFNFNETLFSDIFDTMKNGQARALPLFSNGPHLKQEDVGNMLQFLNIRGRRLHLCPLYSSVGTFSSSNS